MIESHTPDPVATLGHVILGVRFGAGSGASQAKVTAPTMTECGSGWYHDAAVREAEYATTAGTGERRPSAGWAKPAS